MGIGQKVPGPAPGTRTSILLFVVVDKKNSKGGKSYHSTPRESHWRLRHGGCLVRYCHSMLAYHYEATKARPRNPTLPPGPSRCAGHARQHHGVVGIRTRNQTLCRRSESPFGRWLRRATSTSTPPRTARFFTEQRIQNRPGDARILKMRHTRSSHNSN